MGETNRVSVRYIEEVTPGTTPSTPTMQELIRTGGGFKGLTDVVESQSVRSDRMVDGLYRTGQHAEGSVQFEMTYERLDDMLEGGLYGNWTAAVTFSAATVSADDTDDSINDSGTGFVAAGVLAGRWYRVAGFAAGGAVFNGIMRVATVTAGKITFDAKINVSTGAFTTTIDCTAAEAAGPTVTISSAGSLRNGTSAHAYTFEQAHLDVSHFFQFRGCYPNAFSLNLQAKALVTGEVSFMGMSYTRTGTTIASAVTPAATKKAFNTTENIVGLAEGDAAMTDYIQSLSFSIDNGAYMVDAIGYLNPPQIPAGTQRITGSVGLYLGSGAGALIDKYIAFTQTSHSWACVDAAGNYLVFTIPANNYSGETPDAGGLDAQVIANLPFTAYVNDGGTHQFQIDRIAAP